MGEVEFLPLEEKAERSDVQSTGTTHVAASTPQRLPSLLGNQPPVFYFINRATVPRPVPLSSGARSPFDPGNWFFIRGKLAAASAVMHGKAEILSQERGGPSQP